MTPDRESLLRSDVCNGVPDHNLELIPMANADVVALTLGRVIAEEELAPPRGAGDGADIYTPQSAVAADRLARAERGLSLMWHSESPAFRRILVAYDGSPQAERAAQLALSLAGLMAATVLLLAVIRPAERYDTPDLRTQLYNTRKGYEVRFASLRERAHESGISLDTRIVIGNPTEEIIERAEVMDANLIVMGQHARSMSIRRWLLGSKHEHVIKRVECPVMLVR